MRFRPPARRPEQWRRSIRTHLLPEGGSHYRYPGSLTTPGCSEIVSWVVMADSIAASQDQIDAFAAIYPMNARPVQPLNERTIELRQ